MLVAGVVVGGSSRSSTTGAFWRSFGFWAIDNRAAMHESVFKPREARPSAQRVWERDRKPGGGHTFKMMSYNILADELALKHGEELYPHVPKWCLDWHRRWQLILDNVKEQSPDILCLQEVDHFPQVSEALAKEGYEGEFVQRSGGRGDGCATFWRPGSFSMLKKETVNYKDFDLRDNVALLLLLRPINSAGDDARCLAIGNIHVLFNPKRGEIKLAQTRILMNAMDAMMAGGAFGIVTGDFNSTPNSWVYRFITQGKIDCADCHARSVSGQHEGWMDKKSNSRPHHGNRRHSYSNHRYRPAPPPQVPPTHDPYFGVPFQFKDRYSNNGFAAKRMANRSRLEFISPETGASVVGPSEGEGKPAENLRNTVECIDLLSDEEMLDAANVPKRSGSQSKLWAKRGGKGAGGRPEPSGEGKTQWELNRADVQGGGIQAGAENEEGLLRLRGGAGSPEPYLQQGERQAHINQQNIDGMEAAGGGRSTGDDDAETFHVWKMLRKSLKTFGGMGVKAVVSQAAQAPPLAATPPGIALPAPACPSGEYPFTQSRQAEAEEIASSSRGWWTDNTPLRLIADSGEVVGQGTLPSPCPASRLNPLEPGSGFDKPPPVYFGQPGVSGLTYSSHGYHHRHRRRTFGGDVSSPLPGWTLEHLQIATGFTDTEIAEAGRRHGPGNWIVSHPLSLTSAYWRVCRKEPNYTTVHAQTVATVDFVFYTSKPVNGVSLKPISVLNVPSVKPKSMPSPDWASDHMFLAVEFWMGTDLGLEHNDKRNDAGGNGGGNEWGRRKESRWDKREWAPPKRRSDTQKW